MIRSLQHELRTYATEDKANVLRRFFKTGKGEYGEGDIFLGVVVPDARRVARAFRDMPLADVETLLHSRFHEERFCALMILVDQFRRGDERTQKKIVTLYRKSIRRYINNWDLVDLSAPQIMGTWCLEHEDALLLKLSRSSSLWERRVAMLSTFTLIRAARYDVAHAIAAQLLDDEEDLIHKAVGWMLREMGKRNRKEEDRFLKRYAKRMPRTMLRYAIEKYSERERQFWLGLKYSRKTS